MSIQEFSLPPDAKARMEMLSSQHAEPSVDPAWTGSDQHERNERNERKLGRMGNEIQAANSECKAN